MRERGRVAVPECSAQQEVLRRAVDVVLAADHVGDPHVLVVHDVGQEEGRAPVRAHDDEVLDVTVLEHDLAADDVVPTGHTVIRNAEAQGATRARLEPPVAAEAVVARLATRSLFSRFRVCTCSAVQSQ